MRTKFVTKTSKSDYRNAAIKRASSNEGVEPPESAHDPFEKKRNDAFILQSVADVTPTLSAGSDIGIHPKLQVGTCDDPTEKEADRIAEEVASGSASAGSETSKEMLHPKAQGGGKAGFSVSGESVSAINAALSNGGSPLPASTLEAFESWFGQDLSEVRVHTDSRAANTAKEIGATAFTLGKDVAFGDGRYAPDTSDGKKLLGHELVHVVQQRVNGSQDSGTARVNKRASKPLIRRQEQPSGTEEESEAPQVGEEGEAEQAESTGNSEIHFAVMPPPGQMIKVCEDPAPEACLVVLHGNEEIALAVAQNLRTVYPVNLVYLDNPERRNISVYRINTDGSQGERVCTVDPNRIFTCPENYLVRKYSGYWGHETEINEAIVAFSRDLKDTIDTYSAGGLPVVAIHNNDPGGYSIGSYRPSSQKKNEQGVKYSEYAETREEPRTDPVSGEVYPNPYIAEPGKMDDFHYVTRPEDFIALVHRGVNVFLQKAPPSETDQEAIEEWRILDDGSLSFRMAGERYINIETGEKNLSGDTLDRYESSLEMARDVLEMLGIAPYKKLEICITPEWAARLDDDDLDENISILELQLDRVEEGSLVYQATKMNLDILLKEREDRSFFTLPDGL